MERVEGLVTKKAPTRGKKRRTPGPRSYELRQWENNLPVKSTNIEARETSSTDEEIVTKKPKETKGTVVPDSSENEGTKSPVLAKR